MVLRVAGRDEQSVETALARIRAALPEVQGREQEVPVRFWWWQPPQFVREMARVMPAPSWYSISENYAAETKPTLQSMVSWAGCPPAGGRLLLWHGAPGTGKTTAIRALAWEWRSWGEFQFITDPEQFLANPSYLLSAIGDSRTSSGSPADRWRILVLDAGEYLTPDAKQVSGQALSRLLNVCNGVLGQSTRSLVLVTTNEPVGSLHPALSRPGRCLAEVEFRHLSRSEIERWCSKQATDPPTISRAALADLYAHLGGRAIREPEAEFGFGRAA